MIFGDLDKIERTLMNPCKHLTFKNVVVFGKKSGSGAKLGSVYSKTYNTKKYTDISEARTMSISTSDYLVLSFSREKEFEEIYVSYPHIKKLVNGFTKALMFAKDEMEDADGNPIKVFVELEDGLYLTQEYSDLIIKIKNMIGGKSINIGFDVMQDEFNGGETRGINIYLNNENYVVNMDIESLEAVVYFLEQFNLLLSSQLISNFAAITTINGTTSSPSRPVQTNYTSNASQPKRVVKKNFNKDIIGKSTITEALTEDDEEGGEAYVEVVKEEGVRSPKINLNSVLEEMNNLEDDE